jgi:DNA polymerase-3 subunit gamma/tau
VEVEEAALELVARQSTGSLRDALSLLDQLRVFSEGEIKLTEVQDMLGASGSERVADFVDCLVASDLAGGLRLVNTVLDEGLDIRQFNRQTVEHLRQLMLIKTGASHSAEGSLLDVTEEMKRRMEAQAGHVGLPDMLRWTKVFAAADSELRSTAYRQLPLEMALVEAVLPQQAASAPVREHGPEFDTVERSRPAQPTPIHQPATRPQPARTAPPPPEIVPAPPPIHTELAELGGLINGSKAAQPVEQPLNTAPQVEAPIASNGHIPASEDVEVSGSAEDEDGDELGKLKRLWPHLVDQINARSKQMAAVFRDQSQVRPYAVSGKTVTISFKYPIHAQRARGDQQRALLEQVLARTLGRPCLLEAITFDQEGSTGDDGGGSSGGNGGPGGSNGGRGTKEKPPSPHETPRGRAAANTFGIEKFELSDE